MCVSRQPLLGAAIICATLVAEACCFFVDFPLSTTTDKLSNLIWSYDGTVFQGEDHHAAAPQEPPITNASLRVVYKHPFKLRNSRKIATFTTDFVLNFGSENANYDGIAFILAADPSPPSSSEGQWLGIANSTTDGTTEAGILAIEFDTRKSFPEDLDVDHVGLDLNSVYSVLQMPLSEFGVNLSARDDIFVRAEFDGKNISVYVSLSARLENQLKNRVIFHPLNLSVLPDQVYLGFSASKFDYIAQLKWGVKSWQFSGDDIGDGRWWVWITVGAGGFVFLSGVAALMLLWITRKQEFNDLEEAYPGIEDQFQDFSIAPRVQKFEFPELKKATGNFDPKNRLGRGGFGTVYRGNLMNRDVAVKRISENSRQGKQEFVAEVATIGGLHHKNLVKLMGWCYKKRDLLLIYEYMPNGSLDKLIFSSHDKSSPTPNWEIRRNIICGVAEALDYLHNGCEKRVLHRDVKPSNIMLDSKLEAKLGDFGLARAIRRTEQTHHSTRGLAGTYGYMAPEIFLTRRATAETDVYAFGILVLEVVCRRKRTSKNPSSGYEGHITNWVWEFQERGEIVEAGDGRIGGQHEEEEMERALIVGLACCHPNPHERPTMKNVLKVLKGEADPPILPHEMPSFVWPLVTPSSRDNTDSSPRETQLSDQLTMTELVGR
ncbi:probable L-type lectin-domain containing receptor kinase S.5 [Momordica charantia]|uniref:Probable L-type lectin-domain containing receptor kinase S.5 n=1 Tax=Momordica charantia TaxID=3673 RepID=A0A6J1DDA1_MOMCH|nr:probable L-type lectin-domain containing receptor kinase S.5 [Momordica charantia]